MLLRGVVPARDLCGAGREEGARMGSWNTHCSLSVGDSGFVDEIGHEERSTRAKMSTGTCPVDRRFFLLLFLFWFFLGILLR